jgi:UDPglucose 6-dehydrogenase
VIFICVGTPEQEDGSANLTYVFSAAKTIAQSIKDGAVVVVKSTVPVGTCDKVKEVINANTDKRWYYASNPEFLKEGSAIFDFENPDRIVIGAEDDAAFNALTDIYVKHLGIYSAVIKTDPHSSEMIKYASNSMLATRISFINQLANLCEEVGANINDVAFGMGTDRRIGASFLKAGCGYGGSCFPKDVQALIKMGKDNRKDLTILKAVDEANDLQKEVLFEKYVHEFGTKFCGRIAILGLAFKPNTDDMREAPSIVLINKLLKETHAQVVAYDPIAIENAKSIFGTQIEYAEHVSDCVRGADVAIIVTEWNEIKNFDWSIAHMRGDTIIDGRNCLNKEEIEELGFSILQIGC